MSTLNRTRFRPLAAAFCLAALAAAGTALAGEAKPGKAEKEAAPALRRAETKKVCMVNDQLFERDQIPVAVCKERLSKDAEARTGVDPLTQKKVDKATAVIGAREDGSVLYFESEKTFAEYLKKLEKGG
jgi:hypothetical protein